MVGTLAAAYLVVELYYNGHREAAAALLSVPMASMEACINTKNIAFLDDKYYVRCIDPQTGVIY